ncbi:L-alanine dehydrogenase [Archaeoglobus sulfaticallidus PM70-1]|uniref:Alanine dehydrogenase n=1 Tax=Archaeoglobus sulfaticallidus PM70-1 TaxID=387631 RepID=N0BH61_9EURY|nr:alanine dehydrogenase [Archaeoglobus sulfaticallidus]AGK61632.1 L-alanine dehydrogenase [Archaeoglobus sulfaticallidus PM70-1]
METIILTKEDIMDILTMDDTLKAVEHAFEMHGKNEVQMPAKIYLEFEKGDLRAMPAYLDGKAGVKWVNSHPHNSEVGLPTVMALLIYNDPETGFPLAVMDATHITNMRTGAAGGIASKYLARKDSKIIGFIGCGVQAYTQLSAHLKLFDVEKVRCYDLSESHAKKFVDYCSKQNIDAEFARIEKACDCDILVTITPSRKPVVMAEWVADGTHINAIGADAPGKQELDPEILKKSRVFVDDKEQAFHSGEVNVPLSKGIISENDIAGTIGEVIVGKVKGRIGDEITVFDSTGLAIQDISTASIIYSRAIEKGVGLKIRFF